MLSTVANPNNLSQHDFNNSVPSPAVSQLNPQDQENDPCPEMEYELDHDINNTNVSPEVDNNIFDIAPPVEQENFDEMDPDINELNEDEEDDDMNNNSLFAEGIFGQNNLFRHFLS